MQHVEGNRVRYGDKLETVQISFSAGRIQSIKTYRDVAASLPRIFPGFVDIHIHGGGGADTMDATTQAFETIARTHARYGTTTLLLTSVTESPDRIGDVLQAAKSYLREKHDGANVAGVHLEGPFINPAKAGAQRKDSILQPDCKLSEQWFASGVVKMITMAPEQPFAHDVARLARSKGIVVAAGHTMATAADLEAAKEAGFHHITHLCNAMRPFLHRDVGPIGIVVDDLSYTADFICDGVHIQGSMLKALIRGIGTNRLMLITDAIRAAAMGDGMYELGGQPVRVEDGVCKLADDTLAGSVLTMSRAIQKLQVLAGVSLYMAQRLSSTNAARLLGLPRKGKIAVGYDADLVCLDETCKVLSTIVGGQCVYEV